MKLSATIGLGGKTITFRTVRELQGEIESIGVEGLVNALADIRTIADGIKNLFASAALDSFDLATIDVNGENSVVGLTGLLSGRCAQVGIDKALPGKMLGAITAITRSAVTSATDTAFLPGEDGVDEGFGPN